MKKIFKCEVTNEHIKVESVGTLSDTCQALCKVIGALNEKIMDSAPEAAHEFKVLLTKAYMDGVCYEEDREHMNHYMAEGDKKYENATRKYKDAKQKEQKFEDLFDSIVGLLKGLRDKNVEESEDEDE